jgi:hypothetical protein
MLPLTCGGCLQAANGAQDQLHGQCRLHYFTGTKGCFNLISGTLDRGEHFDEAHNGLMCF